MEVAPSYPFRERQRRCGRDPGPTPPPGPGSPSFGREPVGPRSRGLVTDFDAFIAYSASFATQSAGGSTSGSDSGKPGRRVSPAATFLRDFTRPLPARKSLTATWKAAYEDEIRREPHVDETRSEEEAES